MTSALEEIKSIDLEEWLTLNTAASATKLKQGQSPNMENVWTDEKPGSVITAPGYKIAGVIPSNNPVTFCINFFRTSSGTQTFVVSDNSNVYTTLDFQNYTQIITGLSSSFQLRGKVIRDKLWLTNGSDSVRTFDGSTVKVLDGTSSTPNIPKGRYIDYHDERVWMYHIPSNRSQAAFSALTDSSGTIITPDDPAAWPSSNTLQISEGDADFGTGLLLYRGYLHFFKQYSIWRLAGYDEYTYTRVKTRSSTGTRFNESIQILDSLVHLIGVDGIYVFDGEESSRISDIIDPATASQTAFGFNQLQQPNTNNIFWEINKTADWNTGTVPRNSAIADQIAYAAADDTQADFQSGTTLTNINTTDIPGSILLNRDTSGSSGQVAPRSSGYFDDSGNGAIVYGDPSYMIDGDTGRSCGLGIRAASANRFVVTLGGRWDIGGIIIYGIQADTSITANVQVNIGTNQTKYGNEGTWVTVGTFDFMPGSPWQPYTKTLNFAVQSQVGQVSIFFSVGGGSYQISEIEPYRPKFLTTGQFVSRALDYGVAPTSFGNFNSDITDNGQGLTYFTQSSADNSSWDSPVSCSAGGAIGSILRRYLRWGANFTSDGSESQVINAAFVGMLYVSAIHDTGGSIFAWGPFEVPDIFYAGQAGVYFYYRTATTSGGITGSTWNKITPGGIISDPVANQFIQFKIEILSGNTTHIPTVQSVTVNWVTGTGTQQSTLQNVASAYWRNRYWLSASGPGATSNNTILIRGKKTFNSPWMLKDWKILSFARFQDNLYGGSSENGNIYQLDTGYSKNSAAMDSYFETGDFVFGGFTANLIELLVEAERMGPWNLTVGVSIDGGNTFDDYNMDLTKSTYDDNYIKRLNVSYTTTRFRLRFRTNGIDTPFQIHRCICFYKLEGERGSIKGDYM